MKKFTMILNLFGSREKFSPLFLAAFCFLGLPAIFAQQTPSPVETPAPAEKPEPTPKRKPVTAPRPNPTLPKPTEAKKVVVNENVAPAEKSIAVEPKVYISLCVKREGEVRINGWDRDEIRAFVADGSEVGFKVGQESPKTKKPVLVYVLGFDPLKSNEAKPEECLSGTLIELDVPRNAAVKIKSEQSDTRIEAVGKVSVESLNGDIYLNEIAAGVEVTTFGGDIAVENSSGQVILNNNGAGNVLAFGVEPGEIGDIFKAKTNSGRITLKDIGHRQLETNSSSGTISFDGELLSGGQYRFSATNGSILLLIPPASFCKLNALYGFGAFSSEIPLQNTVKKERSLTAQFGSEDKSCTLNLTTGNGVIRIRNGKTVSENVWQNRFNFNFRPLVITTVNQSLTFRPVTANPVIKVDPPR